MLSRIEQPLPGKNPCVGSLHGESGRAHPSQIMVVKDDGLAVGGKANIAFDSRAGIERGTKCGHAVLGNPGTMKAAMREPLSAGI